MTKNEKVEHANSLLYIHNTMLKTINGMDNMSDDEKGYFLYGHCMMLEAALSMLNIKYSYQYVKSDGITPMLKKDFKHDNGIPVFSKIQEYTRRYYLS